MLFTIVHSLWQLLDKNAGIVKLTLRISMNGPADYHLLSKCTHLLPRGLDLLHVITLVVLLLHIGALVDGLSQLLLLLGIELLRWIRNIVLRLSMMHGCADIPRLDYALRYYLLTGHRAILLSIRLVNLLWLLIELLWIGC